MTQDALTVADVEAIVRRVMGEESVVTHRAVLTTKGAAEYCGISVQHLHNLISQDKGPVHYKQGRRNAFYTADLDAWNDARLAIVS